MYTVFKNNEPGSSIHNENSLSHCILYTYNLCFNICLKNYILGARYENFTDADHWEHSYG